MENKYKLTIEQAEKMMAENGGWLNLYGTKIKKLPDNLTVDGSLYLSYSPIKKLPDNLTVCGYLDLCGTKIKELPNNLTVGDSLYLIGTKIEKKKYKRLKQGDYIPGRYLYADGILTHIKSDKKINGYILYKGKIKGKNVISDGKNFAHCDKFRDGIADLLFKSAKDRGAEQYKNLTLDSELKTDEMITMYRIITGACKQGTESFVKSLGKLKEKYTVKEAIEITKGQYNADIFKSFFER